MRDRVSLAFLKLIAYLPLPVNRLLGASIGRLYWSCSKKVRHISLTNLSLCFPEKDAQWHQRVAKAGVVNMAITIFESPVLWRLPTPKLLALCENPESYDEAYTAQDQGRGVIMATPHLGSWEFTGLLYANRRPLTALYRPPKIDSIDALIKQGRQKTGAVLVKTNARGIKQLTRALLKGSAVGLLPDQEASAGNGVFTPYFDTQAYTMTLLPKLAQRKNAPVFLCFIERLDGNPCYRLHTERVPDGIYDPDITTACTVMNQAIEKMIRQKPEQYNWTYKRFNETPGIEQRYSEY